MPEEIDILLVEDNASDIELIREALNEVSTTHRLEVATDGEQALHMLATRAERYHIIILDLNLPKVQGAEILRIIKKDPHLKLTPVLVLTNSKSQDDVANCYGQHANAYIRKPVGFDKLSAAIRATWQFWVDTAVLPKAYLPTLSMLPPAPSSKP